MKTNRALQVYYRECLVGTLTMTGEYKAAFEYSDNWLEERFAISFYKNKTLYS